MKVARLFIGSFGFKTLSYFLLLLSGATKIAPAWWYSGSLSVFIYDYWQWQHINAILAINQKINLLSILITNTYVQTCETLGYKIYIQGLRRTNLAQLQSMWLLRYYWYLNHKMDLSLNTINYIPPCICCIPPPAKNWISF